MVNEQGRWLSVHLDLASGIARHDLYGPAGDAVADEVIRPAIARFRQQGRIERFFFIRFYDPTPHLRLRLLARREYHDGLTKDLGLACSAFGSAGPYGLLGLRMVAYEPELDRYGGAVGVELSECLFEASSQLVLDLLPVLRRAQGDLELRFGHGVMSTLLLAGCLFGADGAEGARTFLTGYANGLRSRGRAGPTAEAAATLQGLVDRQSRLCEQVVPLFDAARTPERLPEPLASAAQSYVRVCAGIMRAWRKQPFPVRGMPTSSPAHALGCLVGSYMHMHLNRLGVLPAYEPLVCSVAARALERGVVPA